MGYRKTKDSHAAITLATGTVVATDGNGSAVRLPDMMQGFVCVLDVTASQTTLGDVLNMYIQTKVDGANWIDVKRFTECRGPFGPKRHIAKITADTTEAEFENGTGLLALAVRHLLGDEWRARWTVTDATAAGFTFSVTICPM